VKIVGEVEKNFRGGAADRGLAHNHHGKLQLIVEQASINEVRYACSVHMNYDCMTPISSFITIATKFLSKH
jgi:hypothetical protein